MSQDEDDIELIEKYLDGKLSPQESHRFDIRLEDDREFARKFRVRKAFPFLMSENVSYGKEQEPAVSESVSEPEKKKEPDPEPTHRSSFSLRYVTWIAIVIIIAGIIVFFLVNKSTIPSGNKNDLPKPPAPDTVTVQKASQPAKAAVVLTDSTEVKPIILTGPGEGTSYSRSDEINFTWQQETDSLTKLFVYSEVQDKLVLWRGIRPGIREYRVPPRTFFPGKYYWYVGTKETKRTFIIMAEHE